MIVFACYFCIQTPFTICYLLFAASEPESVCMDHVVGGLAVRPWFWGIGITEAIILGLFLFIAITSMCCGSCCSDKMALVSWGVVLVGVLLKNLIWLIVQAILFSWVISKDCSGRIYGYGLALLILHGLYGLGLGCQCLCGRK